MTLLEKIPLFLLKRNYYASIIILFRRCIYGVLLLDILLSINHWKSFYHPLAPTQLLPFPTGILSGFFNVLSVPPFENFYVWVIISYICFLILGLLGRLKTVSAVIIWVIFKMLCYKAPEITNGGSHLINILLFFNLFMREDDSRENSINNLLSNLSFYAGQIQICIMYFFAAFFKYQGHDWISGEALTILAANNMYSTPFFQQLFSIEWIAKTGTYFSLAYQTLFPFLIWIKKTKKIMLGMGFVFHLFILLMAGVGDFALFVIASYTLFLSKEQALFWIRFLPLRKTNQ